MLLLVIIPVSFMWKEMIFEKQNPFDKAAVRPQKLFPEINK